MIFSKILSKVSSHCKLQVRSIILQFLGQFVLFFCYKIWRKNFFQMISIVICHGIFCVQWVEMRVLVVCFVDIGRIVGHHYLNFLFIIIKWSFPYSRKFFTTLKKFLSFLAWSSLNLNALNLAHLRPYYILLLTKYNVWMEGQYFWQAYN